MLILTRDLNESVRFGNNVRVTLLEIRRGSARLGIDAPRAIPVERDDINYRARLPALVPMSVVTAAATQCCADGLASTKLLTALAEHIAAAMSTPDRAGVDTIHA